MRRYSASVSEPAALAEAALRAVRAPGVPLLSHADVDRLAGLPEGTARESYPTEAALVGAAADGLLATEVALWARFGMAMPASMDDFVDRLVRFTEAMEREGRDDSLARVRLSIDHGPVLEARYDAIADGVTVMLESFGVPDAHNRVRLFMALIEGIVLHDLTVKQSSQLDRETVGWAFRVILGGGARHTGS